MNHFCFSLLVFCIPGFCTAAADSTIQVEASLRSSLSASWIIQNNYHSNNVQNILALADNDYYLRKKKAAVTTLHVKAGIGYIKIIDSTWTKYADNWKISILLHEKPSGKISHAYAI